MATKTEKAGKATKGEKATKAGGNGTRAHVKFEEVLVAITNAMPDYGYRMSMSDMKRASTKALGAEYSNFTKVCRTLVERSLVRLEEPNPEVGTKVTTYVAVTGGTGKAKGKGKGGKAKVAAATANAKGSKASRKDMGPPSSSGEVARKHSSCKA